MTNKQIIIDGVDVSGCEAIDNDSGWCGFWEEPCAKNPDCIHKKYYRKEQECEELKEILKDKTDEYNKLAINYDAYVSMANEQLDKLKADNDELKKIIERLDIPKHEVIDMDIALENDKLKQALVEIKQIAEDYKKDQDFVCFMANLNKILQKISECEVGNAR